MPIVTFNLEYLLEGLGKLANIPAFKEKLDKIKKFEFSLKWFLGLFEVIKAGIVTLQKLTIEADGLGQGNGKIKKKALVDWLDKVIELPFILDKILDVDGMIFGMIIDFLVNLIKKTPKELIDEG